jgi:hypothetical protein
MGYRYRTDGPDPRRLQRGGFSSERDAAEALERALEHLRRQKGVGSTLTLNELVEEYLAQYDAEPETIDKLCWLLAKALHAFGGRRLPELRSQEIAAWRMTISPGHRFEATQALRHVLARAVVWGMIDSNPAKQGVDNPQRRRTEKRPFESWLNSTSSPRGSGPARGDLCSSRPRPDCGPGEWMALEQRDIDRQARVVYVRRALRNGRLKSTKTEGSIRAVPLQAIALAALDQLRAHATDASTQSGSSTATRTSRPPTSKPWTSDGRRSCPSSPIKTTETAPEQEETESPLTDSSRRLPL